MKKLTRLSENLKLVELSKQEQQSIVGGENIPGIPLFPQPLPDECYSGTSPQGAPLPGGNFEACCEATGGEWKGKYCDYAPQDPGIYEALP